MTAGDTLISVRDLRKTYGKGLFSKGFEALRGVTLEVGRGSVFGLLGPNGAGKTTLIKVLLGLAKKTSGEAQIFGEDAGRPAPRKRIGYLPEAHRLPGYLTGRQVMVLYGMYSGRNRGWLDERIPLWIDRVGMRDSADRKIREYSKGMTQRIGLAQALVHEPEMIFLDEPTDGVDPNGRAEIREIIAELRDKGVTIFINSHLLMEVEKICDRIVIMDKGKIIREGTIEELTPRTGRVIFEIDADGKDVVTSLVSGLGNNFDLNDDGFELSLDDDEQNEIIDRLRAAGIGIRGVYQRKLTLEDAFIDLVKGEKS